MQRQSGMRAVWIAALAAAGLGACATTTPYQKLRGGEGYSEQKLEDNRYRVAFVGNASTSRQTIENYLLFRAAELTLDSGYDYFVLSGSSLDRERRAGGMSVGFGGFSIGSSGSTGVGFGVGTGTHTGEQVNDHADVVMYRGQKPQDNPLAYDAREVKKNLEADIKRPKGESSS